jgi:hypothetical protein
MSLFFVCLNWLSPYEQDEIYKSAFHIPVDDFWRSPSGIAICEGNEIALFPVKSMAMAIEPPTKQYQARVFCRSGVNDLFPIAWMVLIPD